MTNSYYDELNRRHEVIRKAVQKFRNEFIAAQVSILDNLLEADLMDDEEFDRESYIRFMKDLPEDVFIGNQFTGLLVPDGLRVIEEAVELNDFKPIAELLNGSGAEVGVTLLNEIKSL